MTSTDDPGASARPPETGRQPSAAPDPAPSPPPAPPNRLLASAPVQRFVWLGALMVFVLKVVLSVPGVLGRHRGEVARLLAEVTFGKNRILAVTTSTMLVILVLSVLTGVDIGIEGYQGLQVIGMAPLSGLIAAYGNTREVIPLITAFGLASQMGCRFTAQLGAMRISEEVDALEVMAVPSLPYLVTTRMIAALTAVVPLYLLALAGSFFATGLAISLTSHAGSGTYLHYVHAFLGSMDIVHSLLKVVIFSVLIIIVHCYYGMTTTGGPIGVGRATGRAIRASVVILAVVDLALDMWFYGLSTNAIRLTGGG